MKKFALIQYPFKKSLSSLIFEKYFKKIRFDGSYEDITVSPDNFENEIKIITENFEGFNITNPYKNLIMKYTENFSDDAKKINAVNCVYNKSGYNTDWKGFIKFFPECGKDSGILIIGAGGASAAVIYSLVKNGYKNIYLTNRTEKNAVSMINFFKPYDIKIKNYENLDNELKKADILINASSVGMYGESFSFDHNSLKNIKFVYDIVYNESPLQKYCRENNIDFLGGKSMWFGQAQENLKIWNIYHEKTFETVWKNYLKGVD